MVAKKFDLKFQIQGQFNRAMFGRYLHRTWARKYTGQAGTHNFIILCMLFYTILKFSWNLQFLKLLRLVPLKTKRYSASVTIYIYFHQLKSDQIGASANFFRVFRIFLAFIEEFHRNGICIESICIKIVIYRFSKWNWSSWRFLGFWSFFGGLLKIGRW